MTRRILARLGGARQPLLFGAGAACLVVAAALVAAPLGWLTAGLSFIAMELGTGD